jgi:3'(2'), 5'-bisphosphate nucleotidase
MKPQYPPDHQTLLLFSARVALMAGQAILSIYEKGDFFTRRKEDRSPLTEADLEAHKIISLELGKTGIPVLSEEGKDLEYTVRKEWDLFWLVDPLDGTKEFIKHNDDFTVNIALINRGRPVTGVVCTPALQQIYFSSGHTGAFILKTPDIQDLIDLTLEELIERSTRLPYLDGSNRELTVVASRSHLNLDTRKFIRKVRRKAGVIDLVSRGSALKICLVAEGVADIYPRFGPTMEWDAAAGHAIALHSGCKVFQPDTGADLMYNKENLHNPWFIVLRDPDLIRDI